MESENERADHADLTRQTPVLVRCQLDWRRMPAAVFRRFDQCFRIIVCIYRISESWSIKS